MNYMAIKEINVENGFTSDEAVAYIKQVLWIPEFYFNLSSKVQIEFY